MKLTFDKGFKLTKRNTIKCTVEEFYFLNLLGLEGFLLTHERFDDDDRLYILDFDNFDRGDFVYSIDSIKIDGEFLL